MPGTSAFLPPSPLPVRLTPGRRARPIAQCCAQRPKSLPARASSCRLPAITGAVAGALAFVFMPFTNQCAIAASSSAKPATPAKELRYDGRQELDGGEKAMSLTLTAGTFAALGVWAWKQNRRDDELENVRIKEEVERLEKLKAEFMDVEEDDETLDDDDLLASLKQRIGDTEEDDSDSGSKDAVAERPDPASGQEENNTQNDDSSTDVATSDSVDMLKRMWEATDDDQKKKGNKS